MSINYKANATLMAMFKEAPAYRKLEKTYFRLPKPEEMGKKLITYVKNPNGEGYRKEAEVEIPAGRVLARNDYVVGVSPEGVTIYNEWTKPFSEVVESYGEGVLNVLTTEYQAFQQIKPIHLLKLTPDIMSLLGLDGANELPIDVSWSKEPMIAYVGDFLTENGYSISQVDVKLQYEKV